METLFTLTKKWKQSKYLSLGEYKTKWHIHIMEYHQKATWMYLKGIMPVKEASCQRSHHAWLYLSDALEKANPQEWRIDRCFPEVGVGSTLYYQGRSMTECFRVLELLWLWWWWYKTIHVKTLRTIHPKKVNFMVMSI